MKIIEDGAVMIFGDFNVICKEHLQRTFATKHNKNTAYLSKLEAAEELFGSHQVTETRTAADVGTNWWKAFDIPGIIQDAGLHALLLSNK